ncbi:MAG: substrate-binding domain-containing protein [Acidimicrobiia bacterium]|nr:substrate-binding domain-containing protein [Acidimicrobiia bacterium]MDH3470319.1 substrate-binding domain-containing protein [Acidimicrobiia bacterium]
MKRFAVALLAMLAACGGQGDRLVLAAGTTLVDSGFMDAVVSQYERATGRKISVVGESSARVVELGRRGEADVLLTHEPNVLQAFIDEGRSASTSLAFTSQFVLAGPQPLASELDGLTAPEALEQIALRRWTFIARGDGSGTSTAELVIWADLARNPAGESWYQETGQGMGTTLQVADQREGFTLADQGTWQETAPRLSLTQVNLGDDEFLANPYSITVVVGDAAGPAQDFVDWLAGPDGNRAIAEASVDLFGSEVYIPFSVGANG